MKQRTTIKFTGRTPSFVGADLGPGDFKWVIEGDYEVMTEPLNPLAYAEVRLLDAIGLNSERQVSTTWSYANPDGYGVGELVFVPFGWSDKLQIAKIVAVGPEPVYQGLGRIKAIDGRAVSE